jgi:hypothetical protein
MRARNTRRPLCERDVRVGLGGKGKRVKQNQTDMIQLRRDRLESVKVRRRGGYLTARMGFRHPHVSALFRHLLATLALGRCHCCTRQHASRDRQRSQHQRQSRNTDFDQQSQLTSLSTTDSKTQQAGKGFSLLPSRDRPNRADWPKRQYGNRRSRMFAWTPTSGKCWESRRYRDRATRCCLY